MSAADRLRQEGLDAATYKDYIFGMLFLKRCSDVFDAERERIVGRKVEQGMAQDEAERSTAKTPTSTTASSSRARPLGLPPGQAQRRHRTLRQRPRQGARRAERSQRARSSTSSTTSSFMRTQGNKRIVSDDACKDLVRHFQPIPPAQRGLSILRPARRGLRISHQHVRRVGGQEGRRLLHAARCHPPHGAHPQARAGHERLRPHAAVRAACSSSAASSSSNPAATQRTSASAARSTTPPRGPSAS